VRDGRVRHCPDDELAGELLINGSMTSNLRRGCGWPPYWNFRLEHSTRSCSDPLT
jgi:hypothetical protein